MEIKESVYFMFRLLFLNLFKAANLVEFLISSNTFFTFQIILIHTESYLSYGTSTNKSGLRLQHDLSP